MTRAGKLQKGRNFTFNFPPEVYCQHQIRAAPQHSTWQEERCLNAEDDSEQ